MISYLQEILLATLVEMLVKAFLSIRYSLAFDDAILDESNLID